jgi:hypothetical protein
MLIRARTTDLGEGGALYEECVRIVPRATRGVRPELGSDEPARPADER